MAADSYRGSDGPLTTRWSRYPDPLSGAFVDAGIASGFPATDDYNGAQQEGFGRWQATIRDGRRCSAAGAYLRPALVRPGLAVVTDALVTRKEPRPCRRLRQADPWDRRAMRPSRV